MGGGWQELAATTSCPPSQAVPMPCPAGQQEWRFSSWTMNDYNGGISCKGDSDRY